MTSWKCSNCGYSLEADTLPEQCPSCARDVISSMSAATFRNATPAAGSIRGYKVL